MRVMLFYYDKPRDAHGVEILTNDAAAKIEEAGGEVVKIVIKERYYRGQDNGYFVVITWKKKGGGIISNV